MSNLIRDGYTSYPLVGSDKADKTSRKTEPVKMPSPDMQKTTRAKWDKPPVDLNNKSK